MVVRAETRENKFGDILKPGNVLRVAAGGSGSGGELTLRNILAAAPEWKQVIGCDASNGLIQEIARKPC
jgi:hypothetical protein